MTLPHSQVEPPARELPVASLSNIEKNYQLKICKYRLADFFLHLYYSKSNHYMSPQPDLLIARMKNGDESAFSRVYDRYQEALHGVIYNIVKDRDVSQEILQDVFIKIWENSESYDAKQGRFFTWALNISRNASIDYLRSKRHKNSLKNLSTDNFVNILETSEDLDKETNAIYLKKWIEKLEPMCVKIIDVIFFKGFTFKDGAKELDMPTGTLKTRHRKCMMALRTMILN
jgi:RNA polymerase sigma factor (sigma-70 family)